MHTINNKIQYFSTIAALVLISVLAAIVPARPVPIQAQAASRTFPETGRTVSGHFLDYWNAHGGLSQQGYPISEPFTEVSAMDGKTYTVQYFEPAVFEYHPEYVPPNDVLLSLLGNFLYRQKYPQGAAGQTPNTSPGSVTFPETGKHVGGKFLEYWKQNGGLPQQGYPISDEFSERSALNGKTYTVQYFERAVFELHPENGPPYDVLLSQLGTFQFRQSYPSGVPTAGGIQRTPPSHRPSTPSTAARPRAMAATPCSTPIRTGRTWPRGIR